MAPDQNKKVIEQLFNEGMNGRNFNTFDRLIAPEFVNHGMPNSHSGPDGFREIMQQFIDAFPDMNIKVEHVVAEGDFVATQGHWTGTNDGPFMGATPTGKSVRCDYVDFWKMKNGKCIENWVQMDMVNVMHQLEIAHTHA